MLSDFNLSTFRIIGGVIASTGGSVRNLETGAICKTTVEGLGARAETLIGYTAPQVYDDLSWTKGRHSIRTGLNVEHIVFVRPDLLSALVV